MGLSASTWVKILLPSRKNNMIISAMLLAHSSGQPAIPGLTAD